MRHLWLVPAVMLTASAALASGEARTHDGFFLRMQLGGGALGASNDDFDLSVGGGAGALNLEIGAALARNFILYGKLFGVAAPSPSVEFGSIQVNDVDATLSQGALGLGATYYFMPINLYVSGALSATSLSLDTDDESGETDVGPGLHLGVGKEWWVGDQWGIGLGAEVALARVGEKNADSTWGVGSFLLLFSATYN